MDKSSNKEIAKLFQTFIYEGYKWPRTLLKGVKQPTEYDEESCYSMDWPTTTTRKKNKKKTNTMCCRKVNQSHLRWDWFFSLLNTTIYDKEKV